MKTPSPSASTRPLPGIRRALCLLLALGLGADWVAAENMEMVPIGTVQGVIPQERNKKGHPSPYADRLVIVQGVVHTLAMRMGSRGKPEFGFYLQDLPASADDLPDTSDGILVYTQRKQEVRTEEDGLYLPRIGDEIVLSAKVREIFFETQLTSPRLLQVVRTGLDPDAELRAPPVPAFETALDAEVFYERHEGMRVLLQAGSIAQSGRKVYSSRDAEAYLLPPTAAVAQRAGPYSRRVFRDPHPLDDHPDQRFDNDNPMRILIGSRGLKGLTGDPQTLIPPFRTFDRLAEDVPGAVSQRYQDYKVHPAVMPRIHPGPHPAANGRPPPHSGEGRVRIASFNLENLFDHRDDPDDHCDAPDDEGTSHVSKPFNYLPASEADYRTKLKNLADQITRGLGAPEILMVQEAEDQDLLTFTGGAVTDGPDGEVDCLQELAQAIAQNDGPHYRTASDRDGAGYRGISCGFLYQPDRVRLPEATADHPVLGASPAFTYRGAATPYNTDIGNPKALNARIPADVDLSTGMSDTNVFPRAVQVAWFQLVGAAPSAPPLDLFLLNNHFASRPNQRIGQRREEALFNRIIAEALQRHLPRAGVAVGGDLNIYPRPDDPFPDEPTDQLAALYDAGLHNLHDHLLESLAENAYTYVYKGQAGTLDQLFLNDVLHQRLIEAWIGHFNSDWPDEWAEDGSFGSSDHDPILATFRLEK